MEDRNLGSGDVFPVELLVDFGPDWLLLPWLLLLFLLEPVLESVMANEARESFEVPSCWKA